MPGKPSQGDGGKEICAEAVWTITFQTKSKGSSVPNLQPSLQVVHGKREKKVISSATTERKRGGGEGKGEGAKGSHE